ncbi:MAG TPA: LacI family DNA-binding transcriptional regulator [Thermoanaerobaculia bacterium]
MADPPTEKIRRRGGAAATIRDVAAQAGVSVATVSRVLNGKEVVREETLRQVRAAAEALRYVPNVAARSLSSQRTQTIGIVLPEVHGEFFSEVIRGIDLAARREGYHILVSGSHSNAREMLGVLTAMRGRVDGLVVMAPDLAIASLHEQLPEDLPLVLLNSHDGDRNAITVDNYGGAREMSRHLTSLGHSRIAFIKGPAANADARARLSGFRRALRELGVQDIRSLEWSGDFTEASGHRAAMEIVARSPRPTAIFAANDSMAVGALAALAEAGVAVPREMSVVGFDDIPIARYVRPPLTTMRIDIADLGRRAFAMLQGAIESPVVTSGRRDCIPPTLVVRESCRRAPFPEPSSQRPDRGRRKGEES